MGLKRVFLLLAVAGAVISCGNQGTEVLNPKEKPVFTTSKSGFSFNIPEGWTSTLEDVPGTYTDPVGTAEVEAVFEKGESYFVVLYDTLAPGETLDTYVEKRTMEEDEEFYGLEDGIEMMVINQEAAGERGGSVVFIYAAYEGAVITLRLEVVADTEEEAKAIVDEFLQILGTLSA